MPSWLSLEVEGGLDLSLAIGGGEFGGDLAEVGGAERLGRERSLNAVERVEVVHAHSERGSLCDVEQFLGTQVLHGVPGTANRVVVAFGVAQHILAAGVAPGVGAEQQRRGYFALKELWDLAVVTGPERNQRIEVRPVGAVYEALTSLRDRQRLGVVVGQDPRYFPAAHPLPCLAPIEPALALTERKLVEGGNM